MPAAARASGPACCPAGLGAPIDRESAEELAALLTAVADPARLRILAFLRAQPDCTACVGDITAAIDLTQPTVSHHLRRLADSGIVTRRREGTRIHYSLQRTRLGELSAVLA